MGNKIFSIISIGIVINSIILSFCATFYIDFTNYSGNLTHIYKNYSIIKINGY